MNIRFKRFKTLSHKLDVNKLHEYKRRRFYKWKPQSVYYAIMHLNDKSRMVLSATGIFVSYSIFGVLQEKITRGRYGEELNDDGTFGQRFTFTLALVGVQCLFNWLFAKGKHSDAI